MTREEEDWYKIHIKNLAYAINRSTTMIEEDNDMGEGRRSDDHRFKRIEENIREMKADMKEMGKDIVYTKTKIDNGFSTSIQSTEDKVNYIDEANTREHSELSKKLDKILWGFFGITFLIIAAQAIEYILQIS